MDDSHSKISDDITIYIDEDHVLISGLEQHHIDMAMAMGKETREWQEIIAGLDSIALTYTPDDISHDEDLLSKAQHFLEQITPENHNSIDRPAAITLDICYDDVFAPDLPIVAEHLGLSPSAFPNWHKTQKFHVAMLGFLPGFAYLSMADCPEMRTATPIKRLANPRNHVAAGSFGLLSGQGGIYALSGPGGWPIIGRIAQKLFDPHASPAALLQHGQQILLNPVTMAEFDGIRQGEKP